MNYMKIDPTDMNNGDGLRVSLFVSGCSHGCKGCFNEAAWDYRAGQEFTQQTLKLLLGWCSNPSIDGLSILGGEPLARKNAFDVKHILAMHKKLFPSCDRWLWTGYTLEEVLHSSWAHDIGDYVDFLIDGRYDASKPTTKPWRGSDNQRLWHRQNDVWTEI